MLAWKEKVADRLARALADSPPGPASTAVEPQAIPFPVEHVTPPNKGSLSSYVMSLLPTSNSGHENTSPCSGSMRPLPPESLPKRWRGNTFSWKDRPLLDLSQESGSENERYERNGSSNNRILESHRSADNHNGNEETSTSSDCLGSSLYYLTEKSRFISPKLFGFFQSSLPGTLKGCHWVLLYSTWKHGISLRTLLRRSEHRQGPCLLIVGDMQGAVFGGLLNGPLRPTEKSKYQYPYKKKIEAAQATEAAQKLQKKVEELQVAAQKKDDDISRLQAEASGANKKILVLENKLEKLQHSLASEDETPKLKDGHLQARQKRKQDVSGTQRKSRSEGASLRGKSKNNRQRQTVEEQPETSQKRQCASSLSNGAGLRRCTSRMHLKPPQQVLFHSSFKVPKLKAPAPPPPR